MIKLCAMLVLPVVLTACSARTPDCAHANTQKLVLELANNEVKMFVSNYRGQLALAFAQIEAASDGKITNTNRYNEVKLALDDIAVNSHDEKIGKYICKASLVSSLEKSSTKTNIVYTSQLTNNGDKHLVELNKFTGESIGSIYSVVLQEK